MFELSDSGLNFVITMVLDIQLFREEQGGDPEVIRKSERERYQDPAVVDKVVEADKLWRTGFIYVVIIVCHVRCNFIGGQSFH